MAQTATRASSIEFANILHESGLGSAEAEEYKSSHSEDHVFLKRAAVIEEVIRRKDEILAHASKSQGNSLSK